MSNRIHFIFIIKDFPLCNWYFLFKIVSKHIIILMATTMKWNEKNISEVGAKSKEKQFATNSNPHRIIWRVREMKWRLEIEFLSNTACFCIPCWPFRNHTQQTYTHARVTIIRSGFIFYTEWIEKIETSQSFSSAYFGNRALCNNVLKAANSERAFHIWVMDDA